MVDAISPWAWGRPAGGAGPPGRRPRRKPTIINILFHSTRLQCIKRAKMAKGHQDAGIW